MSQEKDISPDRRLIEFETGLGYRRIFNAQGMPRHSVTAALVGFTAILLLFAAFVNWLWWIPACFFVIVLSMTFISFYKMGRQERQKQRRRG